MKRKMLLVFLGLVLAVSGLSAVDDEEMSLNEKIDQKVRTLRENGASERIVDKVIQDMIDSHNRSALSGPEVTVEPLIGTGSEGTSNTLYGYLAGSAITSGAANAFFGASAGKNTTSGYRNNFIGFGAGYWNTTGRRNMFLGYGAGNKNTTGYENVFVGEVTGINNTTGYENTFIGDEAGYSNTNGIYNTCIGNEAGYSNTTGDYNVIIGNFAGRSNITGIYNTNIGHRAGENNTGSENVFIGNYAGRDNTGYRNVFIGNNAGRYKVGNDKLVIDNSSTASPLISGDFSAAHVGINNGSPGWMFVVGTSNAYCNGGAWVDGSSREVKENIEALTSAEALQAFARLEPVKFNYKQDKEESRLGFIAEDVPELLAEKGRKGLSPMDMVAMLTKVVQEQQKTLAELQEKIAILENNSLKEK